jgi:hypothetical protein
LEFPNPPLLIEIVVPVINVLQDQFHGDPFVAPCPIMKSYGLERFITAGALDVSISAKDHEKKVQESEYMA